MPLNRNQFYGLYGQMTAPRTVLPPPPLRTILPPPVGRSAYPVPPVPRPRPTPALPPITSRDQLRSTVGPMLRPPVSFRAQPHYGRPVRPRQSQRGAFPRGQQLITAFLRGY